MTTKQKLQHGNAFPFDAPDTWWKGEGINPPPAEDWAHAAARGVIAGLQDRRGISNELERDYIDGEIRREMVKSLAAIIREAVNYDFTKPSVNV